MNRSKSSKAGSILGVLAVALLLLAGAYRAAAQDAPATADPLKVEERLSARQKALVEEQAAIERYREELRQMSAALPDKLKNLQTVPLTEALVEQARLETNTLRLRQDDTRADIAASERRVNDFEATIQTLEARLLQGAGGTDNEGRVEQLKLTERTLDQQRQELRLEQQHRDNRRVYLDLTTQGVTLAEQWQTQLEELYRLQQEQNRRAAREDVVKRLEQERQGHLNRVEELKRRLDEEGARLSEARQLWLKTNIQIAEEKAALVQLDVRLGRSGDELARLEALAKQTDAEPERLLDGLEQLRRLQKELEQDKALVQGKLDLYEQGKQVITQRQDLEPLDKRLRGEEAKLVEDLLGELRQRQGQVQEQSGRAESQLVTLENAYKERVSKDLLAREPLPGSAEEGRRLLQGLLETPALVFKQLRLSVITAWTNLLNATPLRWLGFLAAELGLIWLAVVLRRRLVGLMDQVRSSDDDSFLGKTLLTLLRLLRRNLVGITVAAAIWLAFWLLEVTPTGRGILLTVVLLTVGTKLLINLSWLLLASPQLPAEQQRPQLYRQVRWVVLGGGCLTAVAILAHLGVLPKTVGGVFDRLFMGYWLLAFTPLWRIRGLFMDLLAARYAGRFWFSSLRLSSLVLPFSLAGAALLGLLGYLNLAWAIAWHLLVFVVVLVGWLVARGLLNDGMVWLKNYALTHSSFGLLWTQDVINPIHKIVGIGLFLGAGAMLLRAYGWRRESALYSTVWAFLDYPLFGLGGATITPWGIAVTAFTVIAVIWLARWGRSITYRWVFTRIADLGVRHSLSVFTQYAIVLIGFLITLNIIGVNLTTLTVFAGALGVGLGFGLQNIANNFVSGLLLLIERPLRSGDIVKIGTHEGEITRIGIRSLTMKTWDNLEVIIPNSEVVTGSFINWTHQDKVIRTVLNIGVSYDANPHQVREALEGVLAGHKDVLKEPAWAVILWEFGESALVFRVQYFVDLTKSSMLGVRSAIMFAIWDQLKQAGVGIPYPQRDLYIKAWPLESLPQQRSIEATNAPVSLAAKTPKTI